MAKASEYKVSNYDGRYPKFPEAGLEGKVEIDDEKWSLHFGFRKNLTGEFARFPFVIAPLTESSSRVTVHATNNANFEFSFDVSEAAQVLLDDLKARGVAADQVAAAARDRLEREQAGQWWVGIKPYRILIGCHYSGARNKNEVGDLHATADGLSYKAMLGSKVSIPWGVIQDIEVSTQSSKRVTVGRAMAIGVFALAAKKNETYTYVHIQDANTVWSFASKTPQGKVIGALQPVLNAFQNRVQQPPATQVSPSVGPQSSVADELAKLARLRDDGILSEEEFMAQKAKLLS